MDFEQEERLTACLTALIEKVHHSILALKPRVQPSTTTNINDSLFINSIQNNQVNTLTVNSDEENLLEELMNDMENILRNHLPNLSEQCSNYLKQFLSEYNFDEKERKFTQPFSADILYTFKQNLKGLLMSIKAYPAAFNGDLATVKEFMRLHLDYKDKSGIWGTTLLWSAARQRHFPIVKYLIESAGCDVNVQNQSDLAYLLSNDDDPNRNDASPLRYNPDPKAASTALHAACYSNNLVLVEYLINNGADYFKRNQLGETAIQNGANHPEIVHFFRNHLVISYVDPLVSVLPDAPVSNCYDRKANNCVWEYKLINQSVWKQMDPNNQSTLSNAFVSVDRRQTFDTTIYISVDNSIYPVHLLKFFRGRKNQDSNSSDQDKPAWIRCRGSSILNFDMHCIWQLMFVQYETTGTLSSIPSLDASVLPSIYDSEFQVKLNSWYTCDSVLNDLFDQAMNFRRRYIKVSQNYIGNIVCNFHTFEFASDNKKTIGFIRWLPKYIVNDPNHSASITELDNFQANNQQNPIPLTTDRLKSSIELQSKQNADERSPVADSQTVETDLVDEDNDDDIIQTNRSATNNGTWTLNSLINDHIQEENSSPRPTTDDSVDDDIIPSVNFAEEISIRNLSETKNPSKQVLSMNTTVEGNQQLINDTRKELETVQKELKEKERHEKFINDKSREISIKEYRLPTTDSSLYTVWNLILKKLKSLEYEYKNYFQNMVPVMDVYGHGCSISSFEGFPVHHKRLEDIMNGFKALFHQIHSAETAYKREMYRNKQSIIKTINAVKAGQSIYWQSYQTFLKKLVENEFTEHIQRFSNHLKEQTKIFMTRCVEDPSSRFKKDLEDLTKDTFLSRIDQLKVTALDEFLHTNIFSQQKSSKTPPKKETISVLNKHIEKIKQLLTTDAYQGCELNKFQMIISLLQRIMIYYHCFLLQLPLFDQSIDLLKKIENNTVITVQTSTGSGKSTLVPALCLAEGYDKIIVTQPRRLPCCLLSDRVNMTMNDNVSGWAVGGANEKIHSKIVYVTDGLLKERLLNDENFITNQTRLNKAVIFLIDEVHERSVNIDLCLALFARLLKLHPELKTKMKLIISSATLDKSVPQLYKQLCRGSFADFNFQLEPLHVISIHDASKENILDLVQTLYSKCIRNEQILCFVPSTYDVHENCDLLKKLTRGAISAYPLVQSQSAVEQEKFIQQGTVFFSTTVAETSLTFPCLKYVIDTGIINMPVYDLNLERTELRQNRAAQSTIRQRRGRLGRTQSGVYCPLYDFQPSMSHQKPLFLLHLCKKTDTIDEQTAYPTPQICQCELASTEYQLRKSQLKTTLSSFKEYLPTEPKDEYINDAIKQLKRLELIDSRGELTDLGKSLADLPDFGSLEMSKAVYFALKRYSCGRDLVILSSILSVINTSSILKVIPDKYKCPEGDFMTLLKVMKTIISVQNSVKEDDFDLDRVCKAKGLVSCRHFIKRALQRYKKLEQALNLSDKFRADALTGKCSWENIAKALIKGFSGKIFVSLKILQGHSQQFIAYYNDQRRTDSELPVAVIDRSSMLRTKNKGDIPASLVIARDVRYLSAARSAAILSFVGKIEQTWLEYQFTREILLKPADHNTYNTKQIAQAVVQQFPLATINYDGSKVNIRGLSGNVLKAELYIRQKLITKKPFSLSSDQPNDNLARNLKSITTMPVDVFGPLRWRWQNEHQVKVRTKMHQEQGTIDVTVEGLASQNEAVEKEFTTFRRWLRSCAVIRDPYAGVAPRVLKQPLRSEMHDMEVRISHITDPDRTSVDQWKNLKGPEATRETRMEVVAWIAVCLYDCRLEGGFVRDWVVNKDSYAPTDLPKNQWISFHPTTGLPMLDKRIVPGDLDLHLPAKKLFDVELFIDTLHSHRITAKKYRQDWRYVLLVDENTTTGPFTCDLIEPHIALTHDRIDFDVSNLSLEKSYTRDLGMRVDITGGANSIQLETIVENIRKKQFHVLRPIEGENGPNTSGTVAERIEKLRTRGWTQIGKPWSFIPDPPRHYSSILVPYPDTTKLHENITTAMQKISGVYAIKIEQIKNPDIENLYEYMKKSIARECPDEDPNEVELYHGTSGDGIDGIMQRGYDDRCFRHGGAWGRGAYFADDPRKSHGYTHPDPTTNRRVIFYNKVILGKESVQTNTDSSLNAAPVEYHSVHGAGGWPNFQYHEYIVYRYGQALPYLKITYQTK